MTISKYEFRLVGHGEDITEDAVAAILENIKTVVKPHNDIVDIDYQGNEVNILLYSKSKVKKNQNVADELTAAVCFKHLKDFSRMYKKIDGVERGITFFHDFDVSKYPPLQSVGKRPSAVNRKAPTWLKQRAGNKKHYRYPEPLMTQPLTQSGAIK